MPYVIGADVPDEPAGLRFRRLLDRPQILQMPGAHFGLAALMAKRAGFEALYLSGAAMTATMGLPDLGMIKDVQIGVGGDPGAVRVEVYLTVNGCPMRDTITDRVTEAVTRVPGVTSVQVGLDVMNDEQRAELRKTVRGTDAAEPVIPFAQPGSPPTPIWTSLIMPRSGSGRLISGSWTVASAALTASSAGDPVSVSDMRDESPSTGSPRCRAPTCGNPRAGVSHCTAVARRPSRPQV